jgi:hypothetical protein
MSVAHRQHLSRKNNIVKTLSSVAVAIVNSNDARRQSADNAIGYAMHRSRSHDAVIRVYDDAGNVIETQKHKGRVQGLVSVTREQKAATLRRVTAHCEVCRLYQ